MLPVDSFYSITNGSIIIRPRLVQLRNDIIHSSVPLVWMVTDEFFVAFEHVVDDRAEARAFEHRWYPTA